MVARDDDAGRRRRWSPKAAVAMTIRSGGVGCRRRRLPLRVAEGGGCRWGDAHRLRSYHLKDEQWISLRQCEGGGRRVTLAVDPSKEEEEAVVEKVLPNGDLYIGGFAGSTPHGRGKYLWADGCMYEGDWLRGKPSGKGKFSWPSGATYEGEFRSGRMDGVGTFTGADGDTYHGQWATDRKQGFSSKSYANGDYYEGTWRCNLQGAMGVACGETATSTWASGASTSSMATTPSSGPTAIAASVSLATEKNYPRICIWDSNSEAGDVTCDVVDSLESSLLCRDESSNASGSLIGTVKRLQSSSAWLTTEAKKPGKPSSAQLRELKQTDFDPRKKSWMRFPPEGTKITPPHQSSDQGKEQEKQVFWALAPLTSMSWANVGDDDDDDYYATTAPPQTEIFKLGSIFANSCAANVFLICNTAQNLTAILPFQYKKQLEQSSEGEKKESEKHDQNQQKGDIEAEVADATTVDVKERIKKVASMRKKKSSKEMDVE
ncbi:hypothetical protein ZIOFF_029606 [Zingiber officinale]|uniref:Uncharacterized protein n=1 Tax=Zingiber officinale TaxID=94328 RepID=A0A8J5GU17_ZINOF|nr:hypothetical protein ZIOFF_029606 [Zingiber officinale]